jgi:hypothetical protein
MTTVDEPRVGAAGFLAALTALGYDIEIRDGHAVLAYHIEVGGLAGQDIRMGLAIPGDWPMSPPPGPHLCPRLGHPGGGVHVSPLGPEWEYWSRPAPAWPADRSARAYLRHLRTLFAQR